MSALDLGAIRGALRTVINRIDGISIDATNGEDQPVYFAADPATLAKCTFNVIAVTPLFIDETRQTYDPAGNPPGDMYAPPGGNPGDLGSVIESVHGYRRLTVSIKCECFDQSDAGTAWTYLERVRSRLRLPSSRATLEAAGCAISDIGPSRDLSYDEDGRRVSVAQFDLFLNAADEQSDDPVTTIERIGVDILDEGEVLVP